MTEKELERIAKFRVGDRVTVRWPEDPKFESIRWIIARSWHNAKEGVLYDLRHEDFTLAHCQEHRVKSDRGGPMAN